MTPELITSAQNPKLKRLLALQEKSRLRRSEGVFVVEGRRELEHCVAAGFAVESVFICPEIAAAGSDIPPEGRNTRGSIAGGPSRRDGGVSPKGELPQGVYHYPAAREFHISKDLYEKVAYRGSTEGIIAEVKAKYLTLDDLALKDNPLVMVLEGVEKPGNLGAVLRSADAAGADAVIICDPLTDLYNPNLIRASIGAIFTVPVVCCSSEEAIAFLKARGIRILTAQLQDSSPYYDVDMTCGTALVMGTEATGLTPVWRSAADAHILIPMLGRLDSLNVSVSAAILLYEAVRQRQ
ncbi:MAG: RNA methyltransferase [Bacteroidales bacterium]|nr:RNA methyltransferase [Bacteroidales bacterium]